MPTIDYDIDYLGQGNEFGEFTCVTYNTSMEIVQEDNFEELKYLIDKTLMFILNMI